jgi:hypothetical protein
MLTVLCAWLFDWASLADVAGLIPYVPVVVAAFWKPQFFGIISAGCDVPFIRAHRCYVILCIVGSVLGTTI